MNDVPKTRTRRTAEQRAAWYQAQANRARASASKQARARKTRGQVLLAVALVKWASEQESDQDRFATLRSIARTRLSPADFEAFDKYWSDMGFPAD